MATGVLAAVKKQGNQSVRFVNPPAVLASATVVGPMEGKGPLGRFFDTVLEDTHYGEKCWEKTESKILKESMQYAIKNAGLDESQIDFCMSSDLLNQCTASSMALRECSVPHLGLYSACASFAEAMVVSGMAVDGGFAGKTVVAGSSHHDTAERQFRFPTELGHQRPPTAQWTATAAGAAVVGTPDSEAPCPRITFATVGRVIDMGIKSPFELGAAMAPAAAETLKAHFQDLQRAPDYYDLILTGDLGMVGSDILMKLLTDQEIDLSGRHNDCGLLLYDREAEDVHAGGSGLGCSAAVFSGYILKAMRDGTFRRVLFAATGALHSPTSYKQGESIPSVCHAVAMEWL